MNQPTLCLPGDGAHSLQGYTHWVLIVAGLRKPVGLLSGTCPLGVQVGFKSGAVTLLCGALDT